LILAVISLLIGHQSVSRLFSPVTISFDEATVIAAIGLGESCERVVVERAA